MRLRTTSLLPLDSRFKVSLPSVSYTLFSLHLTNSSSSSCERTPEFKAAGSKEWVSYEGDRSLDSFVEFLESNATNDIATADEPEAELEGETTIKNDRHDELVRFSHTLSLAEELD